jgi:glucan biosynthesis protein C
MLSTRKIELDYLRIIAVSLVLFYHVGMFYVSWGWHIKNDEQLLFLEYVMTWMHQWRMQLLLFISGVGTFYALNNKSTSQFIKERFLRLFIPLLVAVFIIVPPQIYLERINNFSSYGQFYKSVFEFIPYPMGGSLSWHHMWFVLYLLMFTLISIPIINKIKSDENLKFYLTQKFLKLKTYYFLFLLLLITQAILKPFFPEETHALIDDWAYFVYYYFFFITGFLCVSLEGVWTNLINFKKHFLIVAGVSFVILEFLYWLPFKWFIDPVQFVLVKMYDINLLLCAWFTVLTIIAYSQIIFTKKSEKLGNFNEAILPLYMLHQTVIVCIAYNFIHIQINPILEFLIILISSGLLSILIYLYIIKPFNLMRFLFGMKYKTPENQKGTERGNIN